MTVDLARIPAADETAPELYAPLLRELSRAPLPGSGRLDFEFVFPEAATDRPELPAEELVRLVCESVADGRTALRPAYLRAASGAGRRTVVWARWVYSPAEPVPPSPASGRVPVASGRRLHPFAAADYSLASGSALAMSGGPDPQSVTSHLLFHVRFARPLPPDGSLSVELVHYRPGRPLGSPGAVAAAVGQAMSRAVDAALPADQPPAAPARVTGYIDVAAVDVLVRWEYRREPAGDSVPQHLRPPPGSAHAPAVSGANQQHVNDASGLESALSGLRSPEVTARALAVEALAFGNSPLPDAAVGRLEALLAQDGPAGEVAVLLVALGRTLAERPHVSLTDVGRIRALAGHADARVAFAARGVLAGLDSAPSLSDLVPPRDDRIVPLKEAGERATATVRKPGRPVQTVRRLDADRFLKKFLPAFQSELDRLHRPAVERFGELLSHLAGEAAETFEENRDLAEAVVRAARRYGIDLLFEKDGERHAVTIRCVRMTGRGLSTFAIRTRHGDRQLATSVTWPRLSASTSGSNSDQ